MKYNLLSKKRKNTGFTLLELVVVVAVMGLISTMALDIYTDNTNQKRYELTRQKLLEIKFAIIGDPQMRVGSQAILQGSYYKDMVELPSSIKDLIVDPDSKGECDSSGTITETDKASCVSPATWTSYWKGPYLINIQTYLDDKGTSDTSDDETHLVFHDAWGNRHTWGNPGSTDLTNFGWDIDTASGNFKVTSAGLNHAPAGTGEYEIDRSITVYGTELTKIDSLKALAVGYCIDTSDANNYKIDLNYTNKTDCDDVLVTDRQWAAFP